MNKKGSMELSVNSIVILVIAIVLLGLILGFVRSKFNALGQNVNIEGAQAQKATASEPLTLSNTAITLSAGAKKVIGASFYETGTADTKLDTTALVCDPTTDAPDLGSMVGATSKVNEPVDFYISVKAGKAKDVFVCTLTVTGSGGSFTKDIQVNVE